MPRLRFVSTVQGADTIELQEPIITIGRDPLNVVCIEDPNISKHHVLLIRDADTYKIYDLHSVNTTTVNGNRITTSLLKEGDIIRIGYLDLTYEIAAVKPAPAAPQPPVVHVAPDAPVPPAQPVATPPPPAATSVVSGSALEPAVAPKPVLGTLRLKPLPRLGLTAAAGSPPAPSPAATNPAPKAATAAVAPPAAPAAPPKPTLGMPPKPVLRQDPVVAPPPKAESEPAPPEPAPAPVQPEAPAVDPAPTPPAGPKKFGAPPAASGTKFRLKRE